MSQSKKEKEEVGSSDPGPRLEQSRSQTVSQVQSTPGCPMHFPKKKEPETAARCQTSLQNTPLKPFPEPFQEQEIEAETACKNQTPLEDKQHREPHESNDKPEKTERKQSKDSPMHFNQETTTEAKADSRSERSCVLS